MEVLHKWAVSVTNQTAHPTPYFGKVEKIEMGKQAMLVFCYDKSYYF